MKKISEMSERELSEGMYKNIRNISKQTRLTSNWMTFLGIVSIFGVFLLIMALSGEKLF